MIQFDPVDGPVKVIFETELPMMTTMGWVVLAIFQEEHPTDYHYSEEHYPDDPKNTNQYSSYPSTQMRNKKVIQSATVTKFLVRQSKDKALEEMNAKLNQAEHLKKKAELDLAEYKTQMASVAKEAETIKKEVANLEAQVVAVNAQSRKLTEERAMVTKELQDIRSTDTAVLKRQNMEDWVLKLTGLLGEPAMVDVRAAIGAPPVTLRKTWAEVLLDAEAE